MWGVLNASYIGKRGRGYGLKGGGIKSKLYRKTTSLSVYMHRYPPMTESEVDILHIHRPGGGYSI